MSNLGRVGRRIMMTTGAVDQYQTCRFAPRYRVPTRPRLDRLLSVGLLSVALALVANIARPDLAAASAGSCPNADFRTGLSAYLPDCRAYEQVSPVEKNGANAISLGASARASSNGGSISYMNVDAAFAGSAGSELPNAYLSSRGEDGWQTRSLAPPTPQATPPGGALLGYDFSPDLSRFVLRVPLQQLAPGAPASVYNLYVHEPDGSYSLVTTAPPSVSPPPNCSFCFFFTDVSAFAGASADFSHVIFEANESLTPGAPPAPVESLYESTGGQVRPVGILPDGTIAGGGSVPGSGMNIYYSASNLAASQDIDHAISLDGSHIVFEATADAGGPDSAQSGLTELYDRIGGSSTIEISAPAAGATPASSTPEPARFWGASADGSRVFFTSSAELTTQSNTGSGNAGQDLYMYEVPSDGNPGHGHLTDLTVDSNPVDAASGAAVQGLVGAAEDGSYVYFVAQGQLAPGKGVDGQPNLYVFHAGQVVFIATLNEGDGHDWSPTPNELQAYVTPDGRHLAFMSIDSLTGYDNEDRSSGAADSEVYEYSAETGQLACASCDPSGALPAGNAFIGAELYKRISTPFYQPRALSDDGGRLFFSSPDQLVAQASNEHVNIFEYEYGAIHLISSGTSSADDTFLDASPDGNDVFFATPQSLVPSDQDELVDVYDARIDGGFPSPASATPCAGDICQGPSSVPPAVPSAGSATFTGAGNLSVPLATMPVKAKKPKTGRKPKKRHTRKKHAGGKVHRAIAVHHRRSR